MGLDISWLGVLLAALATFVVGGLWYSVLFAKVWQREAGVTDEQLKRGTVRVFVGSFLLGRWCWLRSLATAARASARWPGWLRERRGWPLRWASTTCLNAAA